jgi:hemolysin D
MAAIPAVARSPLVDQQLAARRDLAERGHFSRLRLLEYEQLRIEHIQNIEVQESSAQRAEAAIANIEADLAALRATFAEEAATELSGAETESGLREDDLRRSARRRQLQQLRARSTASSSSSPSTPSAASSSRPSL